MANKFRSVLLFEHVWPTSYRKLTAEILQSLPDRDYKQLTKAIYKRELENSGSKSSAKEKLRYLKKLREPYTASDLPKKIMIGKYRECQLLEALYPGREKKWLPPLRRNKRSDIDLENFSLIDTPQETLNDLAEIAAAETTEMATRLNFNDERVRDIGAFLVLRVMHDRMLPFIFGGDMHPRVQKVIDAVGLRHGMGMGRFPESNRDDVFAFPFLRRKPPEEGHFRNIALEASTREKAADNLVVTINKWLNKLDAPEELTNEGRGFVKNLLGEVLNNAERHADLELRNNGNWFTAGFMARRRKVEGLDKSPENTKQVCHLAFLSLGKTIAETISTADEHVLEAMKQYVELHKSKAISEEALKMIYALQDGSSRFPQGENDPIGGIGMLDIVELVNDLSSNGASGDAALTIVSGRTCIILKDKYRRFDEDEGYRRRQFFNDDNDINQSPDIEAIVNLDQNFPGVVISVRFELEQKEDASISSEN